MDEGPLRHGRGRIPSQPRHAHVDAGRVLVLEDVVIDLDVVTFDRQPVPHLGGELEDVPAETDVVRARRNHLRARVGEAETLDRDVRGLRDLEPAGAGDGHPPGRLGLDDDG
jgi:hypothetical protein